MDIFSEKTILTVTRLTSLIRETLEDNFLHVWVEGELSNFSIPVSGHIYFTVKDSGAQIRCVMFKSAAKNLKFRLKDGMALILRGRVSVYDQRGEYQLIVEYAEPSGIGALQLAFLQLKEKLEKEGLFDERRKRRLPRFPRTVGVVTSPTGAAIHDILTIMKRRFAALDILIYPVRVQGDGAAAEIAEAVAAMNEEGTADVLIVGRGGGSIEDLWAFNEEVVARAIAASKVPVISAVGHETDWTISDFAADMRAPTPSAAAELVIKSASELSSMIDSLFSRLESTIRFRLKELEIRCESLRRGVSDPSAMLGHIFQRVDSLSERLGNALIAKREKSVAEFVLFESSLSALNPERELKRYAEKLSYCTNAMNAAIWRKIEISRMEMVEKCGMLEVISPLKTLSRGYSITRAVDGTVVTDASSLNRGDQVEITMHLGKVVCIVDEITAVQRIS